MTDARHRPKARRHALAIVLVALLPAPSLAHPTPSLAQPTPSLAQPTPGSTPVCAPPLRVQVGPLNDPARAQAGALRQAEADLAGRFGRGHPYDLNAAIRARQVTLDCAPDRGGVICRVSGQVCIPSAVLPGCPRGSLTVDALGHRDMCTAASTTATPLGGSSVSAGIATPTCPSGYVLSSQPRDDLCRLP